MKQPTFSEVIKIRDGVYYNVPRHFARMNRTCQTFFHRDIAPRLPPAPDEQGLFKCRILYAEHVLSIEIERYSFRTIDTVALAEAPELRYPYKSVDRRSFSDLLRSYGTDDVVITRHGLITDTTFANLVFEDAHSLHTPDTPLLAGTKRAALLDAGRIMPRKIHRDDLGRYRRCYLINAMIDLEDEICIPLATLS